MSDETQPVKFETRGQAVWITIDREAKRNALDSATIAGISTGIQMAESLAEVRCVVITGSGEKAFCAGGDLGTLQDQGFLAKHDARGAYVSLLEALDRSTKPLVARLNGDAFGGGLGLALACDVIVGAAGVQLGTPEIKLGLFPFIISPLVLRHFPRKKAFELCLTGGKVSCEEAHRWGVVNRVVARAELDAATDELARDLSKKSPAVLRLGREALGMISGMNYRESLHYLKSMLTVNANLDDAVEGVTAFLTKREPEWKGH